MSVRDSKAVVGDFQKTQEAYPAFEQINLKGLQADASYQLETRDHYLNIEKFGDLINGFIPVKITTTGMNGLVHKTLTEHYMFQGERQLLKAYGDELMYAGFRPFPQFIGLGYDERTRYMGDFGSRMYGLDKLD